VIKFYLISTRNKLGSNIPWKDMGSALEPDEILADFTGQAFDKCYKRIRR
jgi:hypothetical protein